MMNPVSWLQMTNMISYQGLVRTFPNQQSLQYLAWEPVPVATEAGESAGALVNTYHFQDGNDGVDIRMSSIHSEKGKTHSATLILETFRKTHFIQKLMPWIEQVKGALKRPLDSATKKDMMLMYVGMTRPTHMLCLAIRQSTLGEGAAGERRRAALLAAGWSILELATVQAGQ